MCLFLHFDTRAILNVLLCFFNESSEDAVLGVPSRGQVIVNILLEIMVVVTEQKATSSFGIEQLGHVFTFLARQVQWRH